MPWILALIACSGATTSVWQPSTVVMEPPVPEPAAPEPPSLEPPPAPPPEPTAQAAKAIEAARALLGKPYVWGGRDTPGNRGVDCLGLLYLAWGSVTDTPWRRYPVNPSKLVSGGLLGEPVPGLDGVLAGDLQRTALQPGDVLYLLLAEQEIPDVPLWEHEGISYWPWHTALWVGGSKEHVIHARPGGEVTEEPLDSVYFDALLVTRPAGQEPDPSH